MTLVNLPKHTTIRTVNSVQTEWSDHRLTAPLTVDATLLPPTYIRLGTVSRADGSLRPLKAELSQNTRVEIYQRYGTLDFDTLVAQSHAFVRGNDVMIALRPWLAWWRQGQETLCCELAGPIEFYLCAVQVAVNYVEDADHRNLAVTIGESVVTVPKSEVLSWAHGTETDEGKWLLKMSADDAAKHGWVTA